MSSIMAASLGQRISRRIDQWIFPQREAEPGEVYLHWRRIYIMPTRAGMSYALMLVLLLIGSINYNLSLGYALTFLLATIGLLDIYLTFRNLVHLHLAAGRSNAVFVGEQARFDLQLMNRRGYHRYAIWLGFLDHGGAGLPVSQEQAADVAPRVMQLVQLSATAGRRGWLAAPRVRLQTRFPLGLMRAWGYWQPDVRSVVYPQPEIDGPPLPMAGEMKEEGQGNAGHDDFAGIRAYQAGDAIKHLAWRQIARMDNGAAGQLVTKHFEGGASSQLCLDFAALPRMLDLEAKLSRMTRWVIEAETLGLPYAFRLGATVLEANLGLNHQQACLQALALYEAA